MDKQYQFDVTFFLNNGEKFTGNITVTKKKGRLHERIRRSVIQRKSFDVYPTWGGSTN
ncbi:hypothetical protein [Bacillus cereus group sp. MYBK87-2]|uniref:hypothetical protein n=1 Tax=unclassified Bacillus cereus group TaxID=2750818 RepID=UPI003F791925